jgi:hypothetical protein
MTDQEKLDAIVHRLDRIAAILQLAHREAIAQAGLDVRSDPVNASILDELEDWTRSSELQARVAERTGTTTRTVRRRIQVLLSMQAIEQRGGGPATEYRATNLI